jgi:hypothetical protein
MTDVPPSSEQEMEIVLKDFRISDLPGYAEEEGVALGQTAIMIIRLASVGAIVVSGALILYLRGALPTLNAILEIILSLTIGVAARVLVSLSPPRGYYSTNAARLSSSARQPTVRRAEPRVPLPRAE